MIIGERLKDRIEAKGTNQSELARKVGVSQAAINALANSGGGSKHAHKIARELKTTVEYLEGATDDPAGDALPPPTPEDIAEQLGLLAVEEISLEFGMGSTFLSDHVDTITRYLPRDWLEHFSPSPASLLKFARGRGDSMYPTINSGDLVLIDLNQNRLTAQDEIWAIGWGDLGGLKRLRSMGSGQIKIMSDNATVPDEVVSADELRIIGRVCGNLRKI